MRVMSDKIVTKEEIEALVTKAKEEIEHKQTAAFVAVGVSLLLNIGTVIAIAIKLY